MKQRKEKKRAVRNYEDCFFGSFVVYNAVEMQRYNFENFLMDSLKNINGLKYCSFLF